MMKKLSLHCTACGKVPTDGTLLKIDSVTGRSEISETGGVCAGCASLILAMPRCPQCGGGIGEILVPYHKGDEEKFCRFCRITWWTAIVSGLNFTSLEIINRRTMNCLQKNPEALLRTAIELLADQEIEAEDFLD